jgi:ketosteroid isomerase-like protein
MPGANVEVVRRIIDAVNRRAFDSAVELVSDDVEADWTNSRGVESGSGASVWTIRNGLAERVVLYQSKAEALEAEGARPG